MSDDLDPRFWGPPPTMWDRFLNRVYHGWKLRVKPPWWFCCGWWSPWCVLDTVAHEWFHVPLESEHWVCRRHYQALEKHFADRE